MKFSTLLKLKNVWLYVILLFAFCTANKSMAQSAGPLLFNSDYIKYNDALEYKLFQIGTGTQYVNEGDFTYSHIQQKLGDTLLVSTYRDNKGKPAFNQVLFGGTYTDLTPIVVKMRAGDSVVIRINKDSVFKKGLPPMFKKEDDLVYYLKIVSIATDVEIQKEINKSKKQQATADTSEKKYLINALKELKKQAAKEDAEIVKFLKKNKIKAYKTPRGAYLYFTKLGTGDKPKLKDTVSLYYTGRFFKDQKAFDSNTDPKFNHAYPFDFVLGVAQTTPGWEEIIPLLKVGSEGVMILPSQSGYGLKGGGSVIPPNTIIMYDFQLLKKY